MTSNTYAGPPTMLDSFIHISSIYRMPTRNTKRIQQLTRRLGFQGTYDQINEQAKVVRDAMTGAPALALGRSLYIVICGLGMLALHLPFCLVITSLVFLSQLTCHFLTQGII